MGLDLGKSLMDALPDNPKGFFENNAITLFNEELLYSLGSSWDDPTPLPEGWQHRPELRLIEQEAKAILQREFTLEEKIPTAIKDPRMSLLLPWWLKIFDGLGWKIHFIIVNRHPLEVARSLERRDGFPTEKSFLLWLKHQGASEAFSRSDHRAFVSYHRLLAEPIQELTRLGKTLNLPSIIPQEQHYSVIHRFLDRSLRHHTCTEETLNERESQRSLLEIHDRFESLSCQYEDTGGNSLAALQSGHDSVTLWNDLFHRWRRLPWNEIPRNRATLFIDSGSGFLEDQTTTAPLQGVQNTLVFDLETYPCIKQLRLDPIEVQASFAIGDIDVETESGWQAIEPSLTSPNCLGKFHGFCALDPDPQIYFSPTHNSVKRLRISIAFITVGAQNTRAWTSLHLNPFLRKAPPLPSAGKSPQQKPIEKDSDKNFALPPILPSPNSLPTSLVHGMIHSGDSPLPRSTANWKARMRALRVLRGKLISRKKGLSIPFEKGFYKTQLGPRKRSKLGLFIHYLFIGWSRSIDPHPLFSIAYYQAINSEALTSGNEPLTHFCELGWKEGRNPHPLFEVSYYLDRNSDVRRRALNPLVHFCEFGWKEGRNPHPLFDTTYYLDENPDVKEAHINPLIHFCQTGWREGRDPHPLFSVKSYLRQCPHAAAAGVNPLIYHCLGGWRHGPDHFSLFDKQFYLERYRDIRESGLDPLMHFCQYGWRERRQPHRLFDTEFYLRSNPDVFNSGLNPLIHYLTRGWIENRSPNRLFNISWYRRHLSENGHSDAEPIQHYIDCGWRTGLSPSPLFSTTAYLLQNPDVEDSGMDPLSHYLSKTVQIPRPRIPEHQENLREHAVTHLAIVPFFPNILTCDINQPEEKRTAIHLHVADQEMLSEWSIMLENIDVNFDLFITLSDQPEFEHPALRKISRLSRVQSFHIRAVSQDTDPLVALIREFGLNMLHYDRLGSFQTPKPDASAETKEGLRIVGRTLFGKRETIFQYFELLDGDGSMVFIDDIEKHSSSWGINEPVTQMLLAFFSGLDIDNFPHPIRPHTDQFWANPSRIRNLFLLPVRELESILTTQGIPGPILSSLALIHGSLDKGRNYAVPLEEDFSDGVWFEEQEDYRMRIKHHDVKILAFFLPQFYPIPENDAWHGKGFTEWHKVRSANPLFYGHYQQHVPHPDIGYYSLEGTEQLKKTAIMMEKSGIGGLAFYHYWFSGKMVLERPAQTLLSNPDISIPFCFCWANEDWTRRWDGEEDDILLHQDYCRDDAREFIRYLIPFFKDRRYIRVKNRPVLIVYRPSALDDWAEYLEVWKEECAREGLPAPYAVATLTRGAKDPRDYGMDAAVERPLNDWTEGAVADVLPELNKYRPMTGSFLDYTEVAEHYKNMPCSKDFRTFRTLIPTWDNTPRYEERAIGLHNFSPRVMQGWCDTLVSQSIENHPRDERLIFVNAWNEWAEGAHLEPDTRFGYSFLNVIGRSLSGVSFDAIDAYEVPRDACLSFTLASGACERLRTDALARRAFFSCMERACHHLGVKLHPSPMENSPDLKPLAEQGILTKNQPTLGNLTFSEPVLFTPSALGNLLRMAIRHRGSSVCAAVLNDPEILGDYADSNQVIDNPSIALMRIDGDRSHNLKVCPQAGCFRLPATAVSTTEDTHQVSTVLRFHHSAPIERLKEALLSLICQQNCVVHPLIMIQDLREESVSEIRQELLELPWHPKARPQIQIFHSTPAEPDLRSAMLIAGLQNAGGGFAAILDYDDILFPGAYERLCHRLISTGKRATFARVYCTTVRTDNQARSKRSEAYCDRFTYDHFYENNFIPVHSFLLDLDQISLDRLKVHAFMPYMEDYFLTLQIFDHGKTDWEALTEEYFIGDYIHRPESTDNTLALLDVEAIDSMNRDPVYRICLERIMRLRQNLRIAGGRKPADPTDS